MPHKLHFRVANATSQEDYHKAIEISNHTPSSKGWQSAHFCLYPQDIVISLEHRCQIKKIQLLSHQYLIGIFRSYHIFHIDHRSKWTATKVEFFVGDCPNDSQLSINNARFTRLGFHICSLVMGIDGLSSVAIDTCRCRTTRRRNSRRESWSRSTWTPSVDSSSSSYTRTSSTSTIITIKWACLLLSLASQRAIQVGIIAVNVIGEELFNRLRDEVTFTLCWLRLIALF